MKLRFIAILLLAVAMVIPAQAADVSTSDHRLHLGNWIVWGPIGRGTAKVAKKTATAVKAAAVLTKKTVW